MASPVSFYQNRKVALALISLAALLLYVRVIHFGYTGFDDTRLILDNQAFLQDLSNIPRAFQQDVFHVPGFTSPGNYYRPLLTLSLMLDARISGTDARGYHITNLILHIVTCLLLLQFLRLLGMGPGPAFFLTLAFTVHPILAQAVAWIPGRNDILLTLFVLAGMIFFLRSLESSGTGTIAGHFFFFALALFTKESALFLPLLCIYYSLVILRKKPFSRYNLTLVLGYGAILLLWLILRHAALPVDRAPLTPALVSQRFLGNLPLLLQYLAKIMIPYHLSTFSSAEDTRYLLSIAALLLITVGLVLTRKKDSGRMALGGLWFLVFLLPSFIVPKITGMEHRVYLPLVGLLILFAQFDLLRKAGGRPALVAGAAVISLLVAVNSSYTGAFRDRLNFWKVAAEASPHASLACLNYGAALFEKGEDDAAIRIYRQGIQADPGEPMIHNNLGLAYHRKKMFSRAEKEFLQEIRINPNYVEAYYNLGLLYRNMGLTPMAIRLWEKTLALKPDHKGARNQLAKYGKLRND